MSDVKTSSPLHIVGGGLAGCECAWALARAGLPARLYEMRPQTTTPAHETGRLAELVCSNSFRSDEEATAVGLLKREMEGLGSLVMETARATAVPAGKALAVDRARFAGEITDRLENHPLVEVVRREVTSLDDPELQGGAGIVVAAGPLASDPLAADLARVIGVGHLAFFDAIAPIVSFDSIDMEHAFWGSRWRPEDDDYLNCPLNEAEYHALVEELRTAGRVPSKEFERHFEACLPVEEMADRGEMTLAFGPLKPVGLTDPRTGERPYAVVQLRAENLERTAFNLVGFQTKLTYPEQKRVFSLIPALREAEFLRLGSIHRNTFVNAPRVLDGRLRLLARPEVRLAGQITGVEGYLESAACGLWAGMLAASEARGLEIPRPPAETALGALMGHLRTEAKDFQPSNVNFGLMPALGRKMPKRKRKEAYAERAAEAFSAWTGGLPDLGLVGRDRAE
ncbi:methylenetetrahydrofolate--tRNA-(uracil(54)-C(5))-methyltransferase (FADH(2)-oxidizing) TrmFO [Desulfohalovibrio reitneri]|uniref:methylenetetrahydrofolate--tRNA-(uracil(54)- C(5))-methyltransferase (FADH(2)-oxidizing) TrmFO n=1 Tax=Desulfohalovibrio reitneri TaxID=1307759 RepID=UPI0004A6EE6E|nr:methylenetetrahydrofolate--tRNA-(uracil(54)-C(5))-methyltransferase (FADH(2)-oxidizing) TrmFO [Desulfohalovibrio reitneri]